MTGPAECPFAVQEPLDQSDGADYGGQLTTSHGLVLHVQAGSNDPGAWFDRPDVQASSHWWVGKDGRLAQYVPADRQSWAQAAGNSGWHSVETEGQPGEALTPAQIATLARLYAWGHQTWGWPLQLADTTAGSGFGTHGMGGTAWGGHTGCPGPARTAQRTQILTAAASGQSTGDDDMDLAEFNNAGKAPGKSGLVDTIVAGCIAAETAVNRAVDATAAANKAVAAISPIQAWINSLPGDLPGPVEPPTAPAVLAALRGFSRADLAAIVSAGAQLLAGGS